MTVARTVTLNDGAHMPMVGLGTWRLLGEDGHKAIRFAIDTGYRHIDTARIYGNEAEVGRAVRDSGVPREDLFITTKLPPDRVGRERTTIEASLRAMKLEYVDLWLVHWPPDGRAHPEAWQQFLSVRDDGLARSVGVSNYSTAQIDELTAATGQTPSVNQIPWSPAEYDATRLADSRDRGVVVEGYSPIKRINLGDLILTSTAAAHGVTPAQVVVRWHVQHGVVVIPKSANPERIAANFDVFGFELTDEEMTRIDGLGRV